MSGWEDFAQFVHHHWAMLVFLAALIRLAVVPEPFDFGSES